MANKLYIPKDIPKEYNYLGNITDTYFDLYNKANIQNTTSDFYRIYYSISPDLYTHNEDTYGEIFNTNFQQIDTSSSVFSRPDCLSIFGVAFICLFAIVFTLNVVTSFIKKGGLLGGLT